VATRGDELRPDDPDAKATGMRVSGAAADARGGRCPVCGYTYDPANGAPREGFPAGTPWTSVPDTWICPDCGVREKSDFVAIDAGRT